MACCAHRSTLPDSTLTDQLAALDPALRRELEAHGFRDEQLLRWAGERAGDPSRNWVKGRVEVPAPGDVQPLPARDSAEGRELAERGMAALAAGELAVIVLAGGMATRMGGVVKALVEALPGLTFLDARLAERAHWERKAGAPLPLWLMSSTATDEPLRVALGAAGPAVRIFGQFASLRLTPDGLLFLDAHGRPSVYAPGHGDLPDALAQSGLLAGFVARGGRTVWIANLDNLGASIDPLVLGWHLARSAQLTVEVVEQYPGDKGGLPVRLDGRLEILENFRVPPGFDQDAVGVFNTNTFLVDAPSLAGLEMDWTYFRVEKTVEGRPAVQFERLIGELTSTLETRFLLVPREGDDSRFVPVKEPGDLARNAPQIERLMAPILGTAS